MGEELLTVLTTAGGIECRFRRLCRCPSETDDEVEK